ncbi:hypothetical protein J3E68DRAFT_389524 [Trichoderma sp. SZMC 28012]
MASRPPIQLFLMDVPSREQITSHRCHKCPSRHTPYVHNPHHFGFAQSCPLRLRPWRCDLIRVARQASRLQEEPVVPVPGVNKLRMPLLMYELILVYIML